MFSHPSFAQKSAKFWASPANANEFQARTLSYTIVFTAVPWKTMEHHAPLHRTRRSLMVGLLHISNIHVPMAGVVQYAPGQPTKLRSGKVDDCLSLEAKSQAKADLSVQTNCYYFTNCRSKAFLFSSCLPIFACPAKSTNCASIDECNGGGSSSKSGLHLATCSRSRSPISAMANKGNRKRPWLNQVVNSSIM